MKSIFVLSFVVICCMQVAFTYNINNNNNITYLKSNRILPENLIVGYASWNECDDKIITAVEDGVNVLMWFAINLLSNETTGKPMITGGPNLTCVSEMKKYFIENNLPTIHMISIGGWNAPHPNTSMSTRVVYNNWVNWNNNLFDGFDWDVEGNDDPNNSNNNLTISVLDLMGEMSQMAKLDGYIVSMAPAESYIDPTTDLFDTSLQHNYPEWMELQPDFYYHGHNSYSYLLYKYGYVHVVAGVTDTESTGASTTTVSSLVPTFDFISI